MKRLKTFHHTKRGIGLHIINFKVTEKKKLRSLIIKGYTMFKQIKLDFTFGKCFMIESNNLTIVKNITVIVTVINIIKHCMSQYKIITPRI